MSLPPVLEPTPAGERVLHDADAAVDAAARDLLGDEDASELSRITGALRRIMAKVNWPSPAIDA